MIRKIIRIDESKCNGCGLCVTACVEGAIGIVEGKAKLLRDDYCDGLGNCLPVCLPGAISFEEREAIPFDEEAAKSNIRNTHDEFLECGCPSIKFAKIMEQGVQGMPTEEESFLSQWPVKIKLVSPSTPYFSNAHLLIAADCAAYAYGNFHREYMRNRTTIIGCPKLDNIDYSEKLTSIIQQNSIKSITVVRMEVPCCRGIENAASTALVASGRLIPWQVVTISTSGKILEK